MEDFNPWLDPESGKHKNKKSVKPEKPVKYAQKQSPKNIKNNSSRKNSSSSPSSSKSSSSSSPQSPKNTMASSAPIDIPSPKEDDLEEGEYGERIEQRGEGISHKQRKHDNDSLEYLNLLVEDSLQSKLPKPVCEWAIENFDKKWLVEFLDDIKNVKYKILTSNYYPSQETLFLLKYIFLLQRGYEV